MKRTGIHGRGLLFAATLALAGCGAVGSDAAEPEGETLAAETMESPAQEAMTTSQTEDKAPMLYELEFETIDGEPLSFRKFEGQAVLVVNTASRCGFTGQYEGLQALWTEYKDKGLVVLGVPSNDFGGQEPGTEAQVKTFCEMNYGVDFPLTSKTTVVGTGRHPLYAGLEDALGDAARPKWNFHKVLIGRDGAPIQAFPSSVTPDAPELVAAVQDALASS
ncbi:MAG: glutathione peroxidase [Pseudomonadota bacterium]